jgi:hypothetical protein
VRLDWPRRRTVSTWKQVVFVVFVVIAGAACGGTLTQAGASVRVITGDPPESCKEVGGATAYAVGPSFQEHVKIKLRNTAADMGGNTLRLETLSSNGNGSGTVYRCPVAEAAPTAPTSSQ